MTTAVVEKSLKAADGHELFFRRWQAEGEKPKAELLIVHGYAEHGGRYREMAFALASLGIATSAIDVRGHGKSAGQRGYVHRFTDYYLDVEAALAEVPSGAPRFLLGHSHGALISLDFVSHRRVELAGLVVSNPYLALAMTVPKAKLAAGRVMARILPRISLPSGIDPGFVSRDPAIVDAYRRDPYVFKTANSGWFGEWEGASERVRGLSRVELPLLYMYSDSDPIASPKVNEEVSARLQSPDKTVWMRPGELHEILNELDRAALHRDVGRWILAHV